MEVDPPAAFVLKEDARLRQIAFEGGFPRSNIACGRTMRRQSGVHHGIVDDLFRSDHEHLRADKLNAPKIVSAEVASGGMNSAASRTRISMPQQKRTNSGPRPS